jgi:hypothetical protein
VTLDIDDLRVEANHRIMHMSMAELLQFLAARRRVDEAEPQRGGDKTEACDDLRVHLAAKVLRMSDFDALQHAAAFPSEPDPISVEARTDNVVTFRRPR